MIDPAKTYRTRDGREVRIYAVDGMGDDCVHGAMKIDGLGWQSVDWKVDGGYYAAREHELDLIEVKPKHVRWVNVYTSSCHQWDSKVAADYSAVPGRLACVRIEFEEGEGL